MLGSAGARWSVRRFLATFQLGPERQEPRQPIYFVTLCDRRCCTSHQTSEIPIKRFIQKLRRGLRGLSYFGMIEPAFYANVCPGTYVGDRKRMVCWHLHLLAWGKSKTWVKKRIKRLN